MKFRRFIPVLLAFIIVLMPLLTTAVYASDETPVIIQAPKNFQWPEGTTAKYQCVCSNDKAHTKFDYEWHVVFNGKDYKFNSNLNDPWCDYVDKNISNANANTLYLGDINHGLNGAEVYCVVKNQNITVATPSATVFIIDEGRFTPPEITAPVFVSCTQGDKLDLTVSGAGTAGNADLNRDYISYHWYSSESGSVNDIVPIETGKDIYKNGVYRVDTSKPGTYYFVCGVFDGVENNPYMCNRSYTNVITVEVEEKIEITGIELISLPEKTDYSVGDALEIEGLKVRVLLSNGYLDLTDGSGVKVSPDTFDKAGEQTVTVSYENFKTEFKVNVKAPETETLPQTDKTDDPTGSSDDITSTDATADSEETADTLKPDDESIADVADVISETDENKSVNGLNTIIIILAVIAVLLFAAFIAAMVVVIIIITKKQGKK